LFNRRAFKFFTEALELAEFIRFYPMEAVRLAGPDTEYPDAYVKLDGEEVEVEITWAPNTGRQRGNEYRRGTTNVVSVPQGCQQLRGYGGWKVKRFRRSSSKKSRRVRATLQNSPVQLQCIFHCA
jgi:hypothetical protein